MKLLAGDFGGPNILESVFGRTREGELIEKVKPSSPSGLPRTRGGAIDNESTYCKVCLRPFQRLLKHLGSSPNCAKEYDMEKLRKEIKEKQHVTKMEGQKNKRKAERAENEEEFKAKRASEKSRERELLREKNEEELKATMASEKYRQREILREKNEEEFKAKRASEKNRERELLREKNEEEFKRKRAAEERKRQQTLRTKDEEGLKKRPLEKRKIKGRFCGKGMKKS